MAKDNRCGTCNHFGMIGGNLRMCTWGDSRQLPVCMMKDLVHPDDGEECPCWKPQTEAYKTVLGNMKGGA